MFDSKPCIATDRQTVLTVCRPTSPKGIINAKEKKTKNNLEFKEMSLLVVLLLNSRKSNEACTTEDSKNIDTSDQQGCQ